MADILLDAHGEWDPSTTPAYTIVPKGSTLHFFSDNMKILLDADTMRQKITTATPSQTVEALKNVQNYTLDPAADEFEMPSGMIRKTAGRAGQTLCTSEECAGKGWHDPNVCQGLFADPQFENATIYFMACRGVKLKKAGTTDYYMETGVNQVQRGLGGSDGTTEFVPDDDVAKQMMKQFIDSQDPEEIADWRALSSAEKDELLKELRDAIEGAGEIDIYQQDMLDTMLKALRKELG
jgi:hypothetical protein